MTDSPSPSADLATHGTPSIPKSTIAGTRTARCPTCKASAPEQAATVWRYFPFCSKRCQMVDLGHWFNEDYRISEPIERDDGTDTQTADLER